MISAQVGGPASALAPMVAEEPNDLARLPMPMAEAAAVEAMYLLPTPIVPLVVVPLNWTTFDEPSSSSSPSSDQGDW